MVAVELCIKLPTLNQIGITYKTQPFDSCKIPDSIKTYYKAKESFHLSRKCSFLNSFNLKINKQVSVKSVTFNPYYECVCSKKKLH